MMRYCDSGGSEGGGVYLHGGFLAAALGAGADEEVGWACRRGAGGGRVAQWSRRRSTSVPRPSGGTEEEVVGVGEPVEVDDGMSSPSIASLDPSR
ncbi:hypothetical protein GUJ93_ZPchr0008g11539 [Zizania palustris]|uniref:Uncharacterized protein n=1 Tax=Zizania palustris TaxID=103762 RepID=A0A8J5RCA9_ZIZPA|nr:hypothetical protein GUJ93_ZPchr0008g11539 [Zizania palustris]